MQLTRRSFLQLTAGVSAGAILTACAPAVAPGGNGGSVSAEPIELSFDMYNFDPWLVALDEMFDAYMSENPGVTGRGPERAVGRVLVTPGSPFGRRQSL